MAYVLRAETLQNRAAFNFLRLQNTSSSLFDYLSTHIMLAAHGHIYFCSCNQLRSRLPCLPQGERSTFTTKFTSGKRGNTTKAKSDNDMRTSESLKYLSRSSKFKQHFKTQKLASL
ncbi:hypothetical protein H5410_054545 [Solanum commersonii]|uniref:Uncharacterized protein n=1 Tax=Solanum commersonii TaxID=4109 RepID=A0A9J5WF75_SOLCO|nr:hypothetical protein H5410_054545 [Solanum commersonii]